MQISSSSARHKHRVLLGGLAITLVVSGYLVANLICMNFESRRPGRIDPAILSAFCNTNVMAMSPNGRYILLKARLPESSKLSILDLQTSSICTSLKIEGDAVSASWSIDNRTMAILSGTRPPFQLSVADLDGQVQRIRTDKTTISRRPEWSPADPSCLVYIQAGDEGHINLIRVDLASTGNLVRTICELQSPSANFAWSPDGSTLAITQMPQSDPRVFFIRPDGILDGNVTLAEAGSVHSLAWSPDSSALLTTVRKRGEEYYELIEVSVDTGTTMPLSHTHNDIVGPQWLPDGAKFTYHVSCDGELKLVLADRQTTSLRDLGPVGFSSSLLQFTPDSGEAYILCSARTSGSSLRRISLSSAAEVVLWQDEAPADVPQIGAETLTLVTKNGQKCPAYLWRAAETTTPGIIIDIHGGPRAQASPLWDPIKAMAAGKGIHYLSVNYGGSTGYGQEFENHFDEYDQMNDVLAAVNFARISLSVDSSRIVLTGRSYGTILASLSSLEEPDAIGALFLASSVASLGLIDGQSTSPKSVYAFQGADDKGVSLSDARRDLETLFGTASMKPPRGRWRVISGEGHYFYRAASWAEFHTAIFDLLSPNRT